MARLTDKGVRRDDNTTWLTPLYIIKALGKFDLDPCCPTVMPWRTARRMICLPDDGLKAKWRGRVWLNPPFDQVLPWAEQFILHGDGVMLGCVNGLGAKWGQLVLMNADLVLIIAGRLAFYRSDGSRTTGKMGSHFLAAIGPTNAVALQLACSSQALSGVLIKRAKS